MSEPPRHAVARGALVVDWTLDDAKDPAECRQSSAASFDIAVDYAGGGSAGEFETDCEAFVTRIPLPPGDYVASAVLLDPDGNDRTTEIQLEPFTILEDADLHVPIDFPSDSFY